MMDTEQITTWAEAGAEEAVLFAMEPMVESMAAKYPAHLRADLEQAARMGVFEALQRFDPTKGVAFHTFAFYRMRYRLQDEARRLMPPEGVTEWALEAPARPREEEPRGIEPVDEGFEVEAVERLDLERDSEMVRAALELLTEKERLLVEDVYFGGLTLTAHGALEGVSQQAASKTHARAMEKLRGLCSDLRMPIT